jgi:hypothetical protein
MRNSQEICTLYVQRDVLSAAVAEEKRNPAGVIDLARLHSLGAGIQATDAQIKDAKVDLESATKARFDRSICKELPVSKRTGEYLKPDDTEWGDGDQSSATE